MKTLNKIMPDVKEAMKLADVIVDVVLVVALIPIIKEFIANATNLTSTETTILGLATLFIVLALVFSIAKQSGLIKSK